MLLLKKCTISETRKQDLFDSLSAFFFFAFPEVHEATLDVD